MQRIKLSNGDFALVDDADYDLVSGYSWCADIRKHTTYAKAYVGGGRKHPRIEYLHRIICGETGNLIDHKNGNGLDCRRDNLRVVSRRQNRQNTLRVKGTTSKYKGVRKRADCKSWHARIIAHGQEINLGKFRTEVEAASAYNRAALLHFGEYASLNILEKAAACTT